MKLGMYCIRDALTGFMTPTLDQNDASAMRNFRMACDQYQSSGRSLMTWKPDDFTLFHIADFDSDTGVLTPVSPLQIVCSGYSLRKEFSPDEVSDSV